MKKLALLRRYFHLYNLVRPTIRTLATLEPPYLDDIQVEVPLYPPLNIQVKGYDFPVLEKYAKWVHNTAHSLGIDVADSWATPCLKQHIKTYRFGTTIVQSTYDLQIYERNVQVVDLESTLAPFFFEIIKAALPEGVNLSIHEHVEEFSEFRYIPDYKLRELEKELNDLGGPTQKSS